MAAAAAAADAALPLWEAGGISERPPPAGLREAERLGPRKRLRLAASRISIIMGRLTLMNVVINYANYDSTRVRTNLLNRMDMMLLNF